MMPRKFQQPTPVLYRHFKGGLYWLVYAHAKDSETQEQLCVYQNVKTGEVWVRSAKEFCIWVSFHENDKLKIVQRFAKVKSQWSSLKDAVSLILFGD